MSPEATLKTEVRALLKALGFWVLNNEQGRRGRFVFGLGIGSPDLVVVVRGKFCGLELKVGKNKPTAEQLAWGAELVANGGEYHIVRSRADVMALVTRWRNRGEVAACIG